MNGRHLIDGQCNEGPKLSLTFSGETVSTVVRRDVAQSSVTTLTC